MNSAPNDTERVIAHSLARSGAIPNHPRWPLLVYPGAVPIAGADPAAAFEELFDRNRWPARGAMASIRSITSTAMLTRRSGSSAEK
jgi:hypothetical protein